MKYLKVNLRGNPGPSQIIYPTRYQTEVGAFAVDHLYYEDEGALKLVLCIPDKDYKDTMIRTDVEVISEVDARAISEAKETRTETIKDEAKIRRLEIKTRLGTALTEDEQDSLDPASAHSAFGISEILADRIIKLKVNEIALAGEVK